MSYQRFGDKSDMYVYYNVGGWLECCACRLKHEQHKSYITYSRKDMLKHMVQHRKAGHRGYTPVVVAMRAEIKVAGEYWIPAARPSAKQVVKRLLHPEGTTDYSSRYQ